MVIPSTAIGTAVADIFSLICGATHGIIIHHIHLDANVSAEAAFRMRLKRGSATMAAGSGGSAGVMTPVDSKDAAASVTGRIDDTTQATAGAFLSMAEFYWDTALPFDHLPAPEDRERAAINEGFALDLPATVVTTTVAGYVKYAEVP